LGLRDASSAHFDEAQGALIASGVWHAEAPLHCQAAGKTVRIIDGAGITRSTPTARAAAHARPQASDPLPELRAFQPPHRAMLELVAQHRAATAAWPEPRREGVFEYAGRGALVLWGHVVGLLDFVGRLFFELAVLIGSPGRWRWLELGAQVRAVFVGAIPIVAGMLFLLGVVFAYLLGSQAQQYGASIFVVDGLF
jgi:phospholipid/cholesterol/gamma-HCH transport system permease protein